MSYAYRCEICNEHPQWSLLRRGDVVVSWACDAHLSKVCVRLQRDFEVTQLIVKDFNKAVEWAKIRADLNKIAESA